MVTPPDSTELPLRTFLLRQVLAFVRSVAQMDGVTRIALVGSLTTGKQHPKDADVLVTVTPSVDWARLARAGRTLKGRAQTRNAGADIFLADAEHQYLGRTCHWKECWPGIRLACRAQHCGQTQFLHDDLQVVHLAAELIRTPPIELWPTVRRHIKPPDDVEQHLLLPLDRPGDARPHGS